MNQIENITKEEKMRLLHTVRLMDYGTPSFISGTAIYMGYIDAIKRVLNKLNKHNRDNLNSALQDYLDGGNGDVSVMYEKPEPFVTPVILKKKKNRYLDNFEYTFMNIWDCPYYMVADKLEQTSYYVKVGKEYYRYISCKFTNLGYKNDDLIESFKNDKNLSEEQKEEMIKRVGAVTLIHKRSIGFWGHPGIIECKGDVTRNNLFFCDKKFESYQELLEDYKNPSDINYQGFFFDIFGDG